MGRVLDLPSSALTSLIVLAFSIPICGEKFEMGLGSGGFVAVPGMICNLFDRESAKMEVLRASYQQSMEELKKEKVK